MINELGAATEMQEVYESLVKEGKELIPELFCDSCGFYPIEPIHGHFMCPECRMPTKCCEGAPQNV